MKERERDRVRGRERGNKERERETGSQRGREMGKETGSETNRNWTTDSEKAITTHPVLIQVPYLDTICHKTEDILDICL